MNFVRHKPKRRRYENWSPPQGEAIPKLSAETVAKIEAEDFAIRRAEMAIEAMLRSKARSMPEMRAILIKSGLGDIRGDAMYNACRMMRKGLRIELDARTRKWSLI